MTKLSINSRFINNNDNNDDNNDDNINNNDNNITLMTIIVMMLLCNGRRPDCKRTDCSCVSSYYHVI